MTTIGPDHQRRFLFEAPGHLQVSYGLDLLDDLGQLFGLQAVAPIEQAVQVKRHVLGNLVNPVPPVDAHSQDALGIQGRMATGVVIARRPGRPVDKAAFAAQNLGL